MKTAFEPARENVFFALTHPRETDLKFVYWYMKLVAILLDRSGRACNTTYYIDDLGRRALRGEIEFSSKGHAMIGKTQWWKGQEKTELERF